MTSELQPVSGPPDKPVVRPDRVRMVAIIFRKQGMSVEDFQSYWRDEHSQLFASIAVVKRNLFKYEQSHYSREALEHVQSDGVPMADFDGLATIEAASFDKLMEVFADQEYKNVVIPNEEKFMDRKRTMMFPANIVNIFDDPT
ncbi:MAG: hypothetical protein Q9217_004756 [Psora testacea]